MKIGKGPLLDIIEAGYKARIGPAPLARLTGYSRQHIMRYASDLGLRAPMGPSILPDPIPVEFLIAVAKAGLKWAQWNAKPSLRSGSVER